MELTGDRLEAFQSLRSARRFVSKKLFAELLQELQVAEKAARRAAAIERRRQQAADALARNAALLEQVRQEKAARALARKSFAVHIQFQFLIRKLREDGSATAPYFLPARDVFFNARGSQIAKESRKRFLAEVNRMVAESPVFEVDVAQSRMVEVSRTLVPSSTVAAANILMMRAGALFLDGEEQHEFDTGAGTCVFDWIIKRYADVRGVKKVATLEALTEILGVDAMTSGVSAAMLDRVCDALRCRQYALDETNQIIHTYEPPSLNNNVPPLVYRVKNGHFYPIVKGATSICQMGRCTSQVQTKKEKEATVEAIPIEILPESDEPRLEQLVRICRDLNVEVFGRGAVPLHYADGQLVGFVLKGIRYMWQDEMVAVTRNIYEMNQFEYDGSTIPKMIFGQLESLGLTAKSSLNPHTMSVLAQAKNRVQYGRLQPKSENEWACDIVKCYSSCLLDPLEDWYIFSTTDEWTAWDGKMEAGLYFVETDDMRLFHASNVYSRAMLQRASQAGIQFTIRSQLRPSTILDRTYFKKMTDSVRVICKDDPSIMKWFFNIFVGMLGRSHSIAMTARMDTDINTVWREYNADKPGSPFLSAHDGYYVYGREHKRELAEHNLPMWIQILDWSNIKLFDIVQQVEATGGILMGRKTDCTVFVGGSIVERLEVGGVRRCDVPTLPPMKPAAWRALQHLICETGDWDTLPIKSSSQVDETMAALAAGGGMLLTGYAGTGKSYLASRIAEKFDGPVIKMAPTNKAALNIGGQTIHKVLSINSDGKINLTGLRQKYARVQSMWLVDEVSMITADLWSKLLEVKKALPLSIWLLCGDPGQCAPVEEKPVDHMNGSVVRFIGCGQRVHLTQVQRYDSALAAVAQSIRDGAPVDIRRGIVWQGQHLCYLNATRKQLNARLNERRGVFVAAVDTTEGQQDAYLYPGCPLIAYRNHRRAAETYCVNAERFMVESVSESNLVVVAQRPEGDHRWNIATVDFHTYFHLSFAATVHKSQGDTMVGPITIWDHDRMDARILYTAITRAKALDQIWLA